MDWDNVFFIHLILCISSCYGRTLTELLSHYDTINIADFQHKIFRRSVSPNEGDRSIDFISHGRKFHMKLEQSKDIFAPSFSAVTVDKHGNEKPLQINLESFYEGYVKEDPTSYVTAQVDDDGMITAAIDTANDSYIIEPMWRHTDNPSHDMIVYKASDVKWNLSFPLDYKTGEPHSSVCGTTDLEEEEINKDSHGRSRRETCQRASDTENNSCYLHLVADYNFYKEIGRSDPITAAHYMLTAIKRVDGYYRETCWDHINKKGIGIQVKDVKVHAEWSTDSNTRYNKQLPNGWNVDRLLTEFSRTNHEKYCLAHLFTYQDFNHGVIGLAYVASKHSRIGGICSPRSNDRLGARYHNCGLTTYVNWGRKLTTLEATLVTAHEIGHNFGSNHDPARCYKDLGDDGRYVMYATSVTGAKPNNKKFSECSKAQIGAVLSSRAKACLKETTTMCGNKVVEDQEECDGDDKCCNDCKLINGAVCSDTNHLCCKNCQLASKETECRPAFSLGCKGKTFCNGTYAGCPEEAPKLNSGDCIIESNFTKGNCTQGKCVSLCKLQGSKPCSCDAGKSACKVCCKANDDADCKPLQPEVDENDGVECSVSKDVPGLCEDGQCKKLKQNVKETFRSLLNDFTLDKAVRFMRNNIVITILFFSLLIWIPAGCIVSSIDRNEEKKRVDKENMRDELLIKPKGSFKKKKNIDDGLRVRSGQHVGT